MPFFFLDGRALNIEIDLMDNQTRQFKLREIFNAAAAGYDRPTLRFFVHAADHLADHMGLLGSEHILDVVCAPNA